MNNTNLETIEFRDMINIIGVGYTDPITKDWVFKTFATDYLNDYEELFIINNWLDYMDKIIDLYDCYGRIYHWSSAEFFMLKRFIKKHNTLTLTKNIYHQNVSNIINKVYKLFYDYKWVDLLDIFKNTPIILKGAYNFSLKTISKALYKLNKIKTLWDDNSDLETTTTPTTPTTPTTTQSIVPVSGLCLNGLDSMYISIDANIWALKNNCSMLYHQQMNNVIKYNEIDCKVMWEILSFIKKELL